MNKEKGNTSLSHLLFNVGNWYQPAGGIGFVHISGIALIWHNLIGAWRAFSCWVEEHLHKALRPIVSPAYDLHVQTPYDACPALMPSQ